MVAWVSRFFRTIQAKLIIIYVLLILIAMQLIGVYFISTMKDLFTTNFTDDLNKTASIVQLLAAPKLEENEGTPDQKLRDELNNILQTLFTMNGVEIQVLDDTGRVLATSVQANRSYIGRKNTETVVSRSLQGIPENEEAIIDEHNVRKKVMAKPIMANSADGGVVGAVYIVASMEDLYETIDSINQIFLSGMIIALGLTAALGIILAHTITQPITEVTRQAAKVAEGNFEGTVPVLGNDEIGHLSEAFNYMTRRLQEALSVNEEENEKLASILTNMSDGVIATNEQGRVILMNRGASELLGMKECDAEGKDIAEMLNISSDELQKQIEGQLNWMLLPYSSYMDEGGAAGEHESILRVTFSPIHRRGEGTTGTIFVLRDVTEQEKLDQSRREFVANVSHELRTPLTTIKSYTEALDDGALDEPELAGRFVGVIRNETERMIRLVTDLLHLSRLDSKQSSLRMQLTDVSELLDEAMDRFSFQFRKKRIDARFEIESGIESLVMDRDQIDQVLDNVLSNAVKYTPDHGTIRLRAAWIEGRSMVAVTVDDNGMGIPKKDLARIFERFYRVDKARSRGMGGTGLGLSIAREIIRVHGGTITIDSEWEQGTQVTFTLPAVVPTKEDAAGHLEEKDNLSQSKLIEEGSD
ncbi:cell wall metabolism sensor histidine kinase WalK [Paenibacillus agilis]|uniref:histidine kinase n=1 Tax=Paenibacillus agilis TaxID=3020863 RepID=A0A559IQ68_9BACL|nr:cell wall metabolism sensor histidine kinase WalK [Paenibacillus agilis]TVX89789.1 cell wall metabolism sensor histidine kinase WalK [Paenibacillus agilis]